MKFVENIQSFMRVRIVGINIKVHRASRMATSAHYHGHRRIVSRAPTPQAAEAVWFSKVVYTLCISNSRSFEVFHSDYFRDNLSPLIAFNAISHIIYNSNDTKLAFRFFQFTRLSLNLIHSFASFNFILRSLCEEGRHDLAKLVLDYMKIDGYSLSSSLLGLLVSSFADAGSFEVSKELLIAQTQLSGENRDIISPFVYRNLLSRLMKHNRVDEALGFFREHMLSSQQIRADTYVFNIVIQGLCRVRKIDMALEYLNTMGNFGCFPDIVTYNTIIKGLCGFGEVDRAYNVFRKIQSQNGLSPDVVTYTSIISGYCKLGKMDEALNIVDQMVSFDVKPNLVTFNVLIDGFGKVGDMISALNMYDRMLIHGCPPDVITFTSLIDGHCRSGEIDQGLKLWNEMNARHLSPNLYTFSILINGLCRENRLNEAREFLRQLRLRKDIVPQPFIYNPVIDGFCKAGNVDEANAIVKEMEEKRCNPDKLTFTILIFGHCMKGRMSEAIIIFDKMLAINCAPDNITINGLASCLLKAGMPNKAFRIKQIASQNLNTSVPSLRRISPLQTDMGIPVAV